MPSHVPLRKFFKRLPFHLGNNLLTYIRFVLVCFIWLGLVPFLTLWVWRIAFEYWSVDIPSQQPSEVADSGSMSGISENRLFGQLKYQHLLYAALRYCFQGQIIMVCVTSVHVLVFSVYAARNNFRNQDDPNVDDVLHFFGMRGPIIQLLSNAMFFILIIALTIGLGLLLPFKVGEIALEVLVPHFSPKPDYIIPCADG